MKAAILVAVLFRTLDAYRLFDNVFIMTAGAQKTETVSFLAYRQMISRTALGLGSAVSVLLFLSVLLIAAVFIKGFKVDLSSGEGRMKTHRSGAAAWHLRRPAPGHPLDAAAGGLDLLAVVQAGATTSTTRSFWPDSFGHSRTTGPSSTRRCSPAPCATRSASR